MRTERKKKLTAKDLKAAGVSQNATLRRAPRKPRRGKPDDPRKERK